MLRFRKEIAVFYVIALLIGCSFAQKQQFSAREKGKACPTNSDEYMINYVRKVNGLGSVVSIDVNVSADGTIYEPHLRQLIAIGKEINR